MYQFAGHSLMENYNWDAATKLSVAEMPRYRWPVQIKEVKDNEVVLQQPLRFDALADSLDADLKTVGSYIGEVGVEDLTVENRGAKANRTHLTDKGYNGIYFNRVFNGWAKNVKIHNVENGLLSSSVKNITATDIEITGNVMIHHASTFRFFTTEMLFENFKITADVDHGISTEWFSSGNVWSNGVMDHGTFDSHRVMPFDFIRTQITINNDGRAGGAADAGPRNGKRLVHWNVISPTGTNVLKPGLISMGALVRIQGTDMASGSPDMVSGDKGVIIADTGKETTGPNLYESQLALRKRSN